MSGSDPTGTSADNWEEHWDLYAESAALNPAQDYRRQLILKSLRADARSRVLDIGSGQGDQAADLAAHYPSAEVLGVELSASGVRAAQAKVPTATFLQIDLTKLLTPPAPYDQWATHAVCSEVLEHLDEPELVMTNVRSLCAPGCRLVVTVPGGPRSKFDHHIGHRKHYKPRDLRELLESAGYEVESVTGAGFPFFNLYRLVVIVRGQKLVDDIAGEPTEMSGSARVVMRAFGWLFRGNLASTRWGWQIVGIATTPKTSQT
jgi:2-polyprenyl-3-methyl-5-hydroxy-6-metoxy-1,4-benzoquinol methylase